MNVDGEIVTTSGVLVGMPVKASSYLVGSKQAVEMDGVLYVSPAMFDLMRHAEGDELERLLAAIPVLRLQCPPSLSHRFPP
jgi:hypothetical protein